MTTVPKPVRLFVGVLCGAVLLSSLGMVLASVFLSEKPIWVLFGFELVISVSTIIGVLFALGRFQDGQGLAMACVAGTIAVGSFLGWLGAGHHLIIKGAEISLTTWLVGRLASAVALGLVGAVLVLSRNRQSWSYLFKAALAGAPLIVLLGVCALKRSAMSSAMGQLPDWVLGLVGTIGGLVAVVLISASVHCLVRAFEMGRTDPEA